MGKGQFSRTHWVHLFSYRRFRSHVCLHGSRLTGQNACVQSKCLCRLWLRLISAAMTWGTNPASQMESFAVPLWIWGSSNNNKNKKSFCPSLQCRPVQQQLKVSTWHVILDALHCHMASSDALWWWVKLFPKSTNTILYFNWEKNFNDLTLVLRKLQLASELISLAIAWLAVTSCIYFFFFFCGFQC